MDKETHKAKGNGSDNHHGPTAGLGITEKELKSRDEVQRGLTLALDWMVANKVLLLIFGGLVLISGVGFVTYNKILKDTQLKIQDSYFRIEKDYLKKKEEFLEAERLFKAAEEKKKDPKAKKDEKAENNLKPRPSGDLEKDYGTFVSQFKDLQLANPSSVPAKQAALLVADIYFEYQKWDDAKAVLNQSVPTNPSDLIDFLLYKQFMTSLLNLGSYDDVLKQYAKVKNNWGKFPFLMTQFQLQAALAYEGLKQFEQAEGLYNEIISKGEEVSQLKGGDQDLKTKHQSDQVASESARKYLLQMKLNQSKTAVAQ